MKEYLSPLINIYSCTQAPFDSNCAISNFLSTKRKTKEEKIVPFIHADHELDLTSPAQGRGRVLFA
jgi:hypothetical protein